MNSAASTFPKYPPAFRARRGLNWGFIGLLYTSFYLCRYNLAFANKAISDEFGFTRAQMGAIITTALFAYACGQIVNGFLADRLGGKRTMLIGAAGTILMNILFGVASFWGMLGLFITIRGIDGYMQSFGAPGMVKINTAWFNHRERGRFAGIFGFMINLGRFGISRFGPALLAGFTILGLIHIPPLHWRWLFWTPSIVCALVAVGMALTVKQTPEEAGFHEVIHDETIYANLEPRPKLSFVVRVILTNQAIWFVALAYACTGAVRQAVDQWFPRYMQEVHHVDMTSAAFQWLAFLIPVVASVGSLTSGYISDTFCQGRRAPVAAVLYFLETTVILLAAQFHSTNAAIVFFLLISFTANSTHSILGTAAVMDIGGRKLAGAAFGIIDACQYFGGSLAGYFLGKLLDQSFGYYFYFMAPFGVIGGVLMIMASGRVTATTPQKVVTP
jgi:OPA family glycerol-3-phosphate transporter-like MFS transporter